MVRIWVNVLTLNHPLTYAFNLPMDLTRISGSDHLRDCFRVIADVYNCVEKSLVFMICPVVLWSKFAISGAESLEHIRVWVLLPAFYSFPNLLHMLLDFSFCFGWKHFTDLVS